MKRPCCIDSIDNSPDSSSCSMVLRSACSHGRSHKSLITTDVQKQESTQRKRKSLKDWSNENLKSLKVSKSENSKSLKVSSSENSRSVKVSSSDNSLNSNSYKESSKLLSSVESSLEKLSLQSTKTFSILKEHLYNQLHFSGNQKCEFTHLDQEDIGCIKKLDFSETSSPLTSLYLNAHYESTKLSDEIQSIERDYNFNTTNMSRTRSLNRNSLRALSGSDTEEDVSFSSNRVRLKRNRTSDALSHLNSGEQTSSRSHSDIYVSSNHNSVARSVSASSTSSSRVTAANNSYTSTPTGFSEPYQRNASVNASQVNISVVQYSSILDRLRWLLWKYIYLKIITIVNFDVWLLSRLRGRRSFVVVILLPLMLYLLYSLLGSGNELMSMSLDVLSSSVSTLASSLNSLLILPFQQSEETVKEAEPSFCTKPGSFLSAFWGIPSFFSKIFISEKTTSFTSQTTSHSVDSKIKSGNSITKQDIELLTVKTLDARFNELAKKMQASQDVKANDVNALRKEISDLHVLFKSLSSSIQQLEKNIHHTDNGRVVVFDSLNTRMKDFEEKLASLSGLKRCCDEKLTVADFTTSIEKHIVTAFRNVMAGEKNTASPYHFFHQWLNSKFIDPNKLSSEINAAFGKMKTQQSSDIKLDQNSMNVIKSIVQHYVETLKTNLTPVGSTKTTYDNSLTHHDMRRIVKEALMLYDADKTGKVDYALESGGGSILSTRCSESYIEKNGRFTVLGVPLWSDENSPRTAIQPDVQPGKCWAFKGSHGYLVIQLSYTIYPTGFTLEHIPVSLSPSGSIDSAPKDFSVWGLSSEKDFEGTLLGKYTFEIDEEPLQYFEVQNLTSVPFSLVELKIHSNHGNLEYTCLYRFRVHGTRA